MFDSRTARKEKRTPIFLQLQARRNNRKVSSRSRKRIESSRIGHSYLLNETSTQQLESFSSAQREKILSVRKKKKENRGWTRWPLRNSLISFGFSSNVLQSSSVEISEELPFEEFCSIYSTIFSGYGFIQKV